MTYWRAVASQFVAVGLTLIGLIAIAVWAEGLAWFTK